MESRLLSHPSSVPCSTRLLQLARVTVLSLIGYLLISYYSFELRILSAPASRLTFADQFLEGISNDTIAKFLENLTREPHVAGTAENLATAKYVSSVFEDSGISTHYSDYQVLLTYPVKRELSLLLPDGSQREFLLKEEEVEGDPSTKNPKAIPTFFAYSKSGRVTAEVVYANYGQDEDFQHLKDKGVDVTGAVVIARYGKVFRGDIVENAANAGAVAAIVFSDPADYAANGTHGFYPSSKWLPLSGVQRGSVLSTSGDPLTPGWASVQGAERVEMTEKMLSSIPAMPISGEDALPILEALEGEVAPPSWQGGLNISAYRFGRGPAKLKFWYESNETVAPITDVIGVIEGYEDPDRYVILGNHRDAWTFGGADPNSGTASLLEIARGFGNLLKSGWKPRRTIVLCSWDAEEYGLIGSTEWMERNFKLLSTRAVVYINVDRAVGGPKFDASSTPQLDRILLEVSKKVKDPNAEYDTVYEAWSALNKNLTPYIGRLGSGRSDFAPFLQNAGIPSYDLRYQRSFPVYHSLYDDFLWMKTFGDPLFKRHVAVSGLWGLLAIRFSTNEFIPFDYTAYADELETSAKALEAVLKSSNASNGVSVSPVFTAILKFRAACAEIEKQLKAKSTPTQKRSLNDRLIQAERSFLEPGKPWSKHLIYGPTVHNRYGGDSFPSISRALDTAVTKGDAQSWKKVQQEIWKLARGVADAAAVLHGDLN